MKAKQWWLFGGNINKKMVCLKLGNVENHYNSWGPEESVQLVYDYNNNYMVSESYNHS